MVMRLPHRCAEGQDVRRYLATLFPPANRSTVVAKTKVTVSMSSDWKLSPDSVEIRRTVTTTTRLWPHSYGEKMKIKWAGRLTHTPARYRLRSYPKSERRWCWASEPTRAKARERETERGRERGSESERGINALVLKNLRNALILSNPSLRALPVLWTTSD